MNKAIDSYDKLPLASYMELQRICAEEDLLDIDRQAAVNAVLADMSVEDVMTLPLADFREISRRAKFLEEPPATRRISPRHITAGGFNLTVHTDITQITAGQFVDFQGLSKLEDPRMHVAELLSCFLIPRGRRYNDGRYDLAEVQQAIREGMTVTEAYGVVAFFLRRWRNLLLSTLIFCRWTLKRQKVTSPEMEATLAQVQELSTLLSTDGDGLTPSLLFPRLCVLRGAL